MQEAIGILMHRLEIRSVDACALLTSSATAMDLDAARLAQEIVDELESRHLFTTKPGDASSG